MSEVEPTRKRLEWASDIPPDWDVVNLRMLARIFAGGTPDRKNTDYWTDGTVPWLNSGSVNDWAIWTPSELISGAALANGATRWAPKGSVLVALAGQGKTKGMAARLEIDSTLNQSLAAIVPGPSLEYRFLQYWLTSNYGNIRGLAGGDLRDGLNLQHIGSIQVPRPPVEEQRAIADYLDRETAQIDAFIAKNEELISLLTERRLAVISHAVTSGSDSNRQTRESGNGWLGSVPNHWDVLKLRHVLAEPITDGPHTTPEFLDDGVPFLSVDGIVDGELEFEGCRYVSPTDHEEFSRKASPRRGDVLMGKAASVGKIARVKTDQVFSIWSPLALLRPKPAISPAYMELCLKSASAQAQFAVFANYNTQANISMGDIGEVVIAMPPIDEQLSIVEATLRDLDGIDRAVVVARSSVELARERRAALISAAVTGKIDVGVSV